MNSLELINIVKRWKLHLVVVAVIAFIASVIFSGPAFITPKYKSFAIVYHGNLIAYSTESSTEQMLQLLQSSYIRDEVVNQFRLAERYNIDTTSEQWQSDLFKRYEENVTIKKTEFESVEIDVLDKDPKLASAMVDSILRYLDVKARALHRDKASEIVVIARNQLMLKKAEMDSMETMVQDLRGKYGMLDYMLQTKEVTRGYLKGLTAGRGGASMNEIKTMINNLQSKGGEYFELNEHLGRVRSTYDDLKVGYENALKDVNKELTYSNVVTHPIPADKKSYPIRWLIVTLSVAGSLLFSLLLILLIAPTKK